MNLKLEVQMVETRSWEGQGHYMPFIFILQALDGLHGELYQALS